MKSAKIILTIFICGLLFSCKNSTSSNGTTSDAGGSSAASITVLSNQAISGYPHAIDYYMASNAETAIVFLHGGGGKKENFAADLGIKNDTSTSNFDVSTAGQDWLRNNKIVAIFPQGQTLSGYNAWSWSNYVMNSGQDDVAFLRALVAAIKANSSFSKVSKIFLAGHSNGGMMANRMWCESPATFDGYGSLAGPPSSHLSVSAGSNPCAPTIVKPYIGIVGNSDTVLQTTGNMNATLWTTNPILHAGNPPTWVDATPMVINEKYFHVNRVNLKCGGSVASPATSGQLTTYSDCGGSLKLIIISQVTVNSTPSGGDHCLDRLSASCVTTLNGGTGIDYKDTLLSFFKSN